MIFFRLQSVPTIPGGKLHHLEGWLHAFAGIISKLEPGDEQQIYDEQEQRRRHRNMADMYNPAFAYFLHDVVTTSHLKVELDGRLIQRVEIAQGDVRPIKSDNHCWIILHMSDESAYCLDFCGGAYWRKEAHSPWVIKTLARASRRYVVDPVTHGQILSPETDFQQRQEAARMGEAIVHHHHHHHHHHNGQTHEMARRAVSSRDVREELVALLVERLDREISIVEFH